MAAVAQETLASFSPQQIPQSSRWGLTHLPSVPQRQIRHRASPGKLRNSSPFVRAWQKNDHVPPEPPVNIESGPGKLVTRGDAAVARLQKLQCAGTPAGGASPLPLESIPRRQRRDRKLKLWNKYRISNIPSLIFLDATTGKVVCRNGLLVIRDDPEGLEFPWGPKPFREVIAGPLLRNNGQSLESSSLEGSHVGVYFSAHWCPPCRSLTRVLVESYRKIKEAGQKFEIIFVSADRSEDSFKQYFSEMPWLAVPYTDEARRSRLNRLYGIQGIPTLIVLDPQGEVITRQGRVEVLNDADCREFPWHPKPVLELSDSNAVQLNEGPCLVLFVDSEDDGESEAAKQLIQPIAEKIIAKYKAKEEEAPLLFFVAGEDDMTDSLRDYTNLPEAAPLLTILDMSARAKYVMDVEEITPAIVEAFVNDFLAEKLKPEPI
ncbi:PREDICTED: nucleoredoxin [Myotis davidii]|uniref:nucleoredoxin n=1 Tax=Myotis davidii TaxID=225400 RepID=UPI000766FE90|nr:PREDICTED: nucleoredoxin [Myotis davidii]